MAVVAHVILRGVSPEQYDAVRAETDWIENPPDGGYSHVAFQAFAEDRLGPSMATLGIEVAP